MGFYIQFADEGLEEAIKNHANPDGFATIEEAHDQANLCAYGKVDYVILHRMRYQEHSRYTEVDKGTTKGE